MSRRARRSLRPRQRAPGSAPLPAVADPLSGEQAALLALQETAGNRAVKALMRRSGNPLPDGTRTAMEQRLGADLEDVKVHTDPAAAHQAEALGAHAYTAGTDIGFAPGAYAPGTAAGDQLLAHELAHVAQQKRTGLTADPARVTPPAHPSERQAAAAARGEPTTLDAAPVGVALYAPGPDPDKEPQPGAAPAPAAVPPLEDEFADDDAEARRADAIAEGIDVAETRARTYLNSDYNEVQDAARDFAVGTHSEIEKLPGTPSGYWGLANSLVGFGTGAVTAMFSQMSKVARAMTIASGLHSGALAAISDRVDDDRKEPKTAAKNAMNSVAKVISYSTESYFDALRDNLYTALLNLANSDDEAAVLLETGTVSAIDTVIKDHLGIPDPDAAEMYRAVRERMEIAFAEWAAGQELSRAHGYLGSIPGLRANETTNRTARAAARARVDQAVAARTGEPPPPSGFEVATDALVHWDQHFMKGWEIAMSDPATWEVPEEEEAQVMDFTGEVEPVDIEAETGAQRREQRIGRGVTLADTRAREFLNTHYNDAQDAVRDFVASAEEQIDAMPGTPSGHWGLIHTLFGAAMAILGARFPPVMIGKVIATQAASAVASGIGTAATTAVDDSRAAKKDNAREAMQKFATATGNAQAGVFAKARQAVGPNLTTLAASDDEARMLLENANTEGLDTLATAGIGMPHPDDVSVYADVREKMDVPFAAWIQKQNWLEEGLGWLAASFEPNAAPARRQVTLEAAAREFTAETAPGEAAADLEVKFEEDEVVSGGEPASALTETETDPEAELDRLILRRIVDVDTRARTFLNGHHDAVQDALRDFMASANLRIEAIGSKYGTYANVGSALLGIVSGVALASFPVVGAIVGGALSVAGQAISGYYADKTLSAKANARRQLRSFARETELALIKGFKQARALMGPLLLATAFTDEDARAAIALGGQDRYDFVIEEFLGVVSPDRLDLYEEVRKPLEEEFVTWLSALQELDEEETTAAVAAAVSEAEDDAALRRGGAAPSMDSKGKL